MAGHLGDEGSAYTVTGLTNAGNGYHNPKSDASANSATIRAEGVFYGIHVNPVTIGSDLHAVVNPQTDPLARVAVACLLLAPSGS